MHLTWHDVEGQLQPGMHTALHSKSLLMAVLESVQSFVPDCSVTYLLPTAAWLGAVGVAADAEQHTPLPAEAEPPAEPASAAAASPGGIDKDINPEKMTVSMPGQLRLVGCLVIRLLTCLRFLGKQGLARACSNTVRAILA